MGFDLLDSHPESRDQALTTKVRARFIMRAETHLAPEEPPAPMPAIDPVASRRIFFAILLLLTGGFISYRLLRRPAGPPPVDIAADALLVEGRSNYLSRCVSCHGATGRGDGP